METSLLNAVEYGVLPGEGLGEPNSAALQRAVDELGAAGGGTLFIPNGVYEFADAISIEINTDPTGSGTLHVSGDRMPVLVRTDDCNLFVVTECDSGPFGHVVFEGLHLQGNLEAQTS
jgi:hypothetical protein